MVCQIGNSVRPQFAGPRAQKECIEICAVGEIPLDRFFRGAFDAIPVQLWDAAITPSAHARSARARRRWMREAAASDPALTGAQAREKTTMLYRSMNVRSSFVDLPDRDLLIEVKRLAQVERDATAALVASLAEVDGRELHLGEGCSSLFVYCTQVLHLSESAAYARIAAARAGRRFPLILDLLAAGDVTLTTICLLAPHLTDATHRAVLESARHKSKREVQGIVASLHPLPDVPATIRKLPAPTASNAATRTERASVAPLPIEAATGPMSPGGGAPVTASATAPVAAPSIPPPMARPSIIAPLAPERYRVQFTVGRQTHDKLRRAQDLLRHSVPNGDPAEIVDRALTLLVEHLERSKLAAVNRPRPPSVRVTDSRHIPSSVKRSVWTRDGGRCAFEGREGRCTERGCLEFHHVVPYADGGTATNENIQLRCRAHNRYDADQWFGGGGVFLRERPPDGAWHGAHADTGR